MNVAVIRLKHMNNQKCIAIANLLLMLAVGIAWFCGVRNALVTSVGVATFGFAFLWPQYKSEQGVWMGGALILLFSVVVLSVISSFFWSAPIDDMARSEYSKAGVLAGMAVLTPFTAFAIYATIVNFRLSRTQRHPPDHLESAENP